MLMDHPLNRRVVLCIIIIYNTRPISEKQSMLIRLLEANHIVSIFSKVTTNISVPNTSLPQAKGLRYKTNPAVMA